LKPSSPIASGDATTVHGMMSLYELPQDLLVSALEGLVYRLDELRFKKSPGNETLKTSFVSGPQTTHFHQDRCSQRYRPKNSSIKPIPPSDGDYSLAKRGGVDQQGREPRRCHHRDRGGFPSHHNSYFPRVRRIGRNRKRNNRIKLIPPSKGDFCLPIQSGQDIPGTHDPRDIYGCYPGFFAPAP